MNQAETLVNDLVQSTGCDRSIAGLMLQFTGGNFEGARRIIGSVPKDIHAVKIKFISPSSGYCGAFIFFYDEFEKRVVRFFAVAGEDKEIAKLDVASKWRKYEEELHRYARDRALDAVKIEQLRKQVHEEGFIAKIGELLKAEKPESGEQLKSFIVDWLYPLFADANLAVKLHVDLTDAFELNKKMNMAEEKPKAEDAKREAGAAGAADDSAVLGGEEKIGRYSTRHGLSLVVLKVDPVLSPVSGVEVSRLEFGDEVHVRITDERDIAEYLSELLGGKSGENRLPVPTKIIESKELPSGELGVITQFGPGIMGMFKVLPDVKVMSKSEAPEARRVSILKSREIHPFLIMAGIAVGIFIFLLLIILLR